MTREEITTTVFALQAQVDQCRDMTTEIEERYNALENAEIAPIQAQQDELERQRDQTLADGLKAADFLPWKPGDFLATHSRDRFYEITRWETQLDYNKKLVRFSCRTFEIRKSGTLARYYTTWNMDDPDIELVDPSIDLRLRRRLKMKLRHRLEGGD